MIVNKHELTIIYRVHYALSEQNERTKMLDEYYDEMQCANCDEYFETVGEADNGEPCPGESIYI